MTKNHLFTSESVTCGHPDKMADQISDAILDACLAQDPFSRVACETLVCPGIVILAGEITSTASIDYEAVARDVVKDIGYTDGAMGFDYKSFGILTSIKKQSTDIAIGVDERKQEGKELGAGDQGLMFGFACDESQELMPLPINLAHRIVTSLALVRKSGELPYLRPDGKSQVTIEYDQNQTPLRLHTVVLSTQHAADINQSTIRQDMVELIKKNVPAELIDNQTRFLINPTGRFVIGGPASDCGLTGRKIIVDTYGGMGRHGGGAFSGKDPTKVDRSASYAARYIAKNIVAAGLARRCEIQLSYAIGVSQPVSIEVNTFGTGKVSDSDLTDVIPSLFDLSPGGLIQMLALRRPIYLKTAVGGHFGRFEPEFTWEKTDQTDTLKNKWF